MEIAIGAAVTIGLAIITGMGALAFKDPETNKRLFKITKGPTNTVSNFAMGVVSGAVLVGVGDFGHWKVVGVAGAIALACLAYSLVFVFFVWLRDDFARYADKD